MENVIKTIETAYEIHPYPWYLKARTKSLDRLFGTDATQNAIATKENTICIANIMFILYLHKLA
jgi:hypothetical protein